ncbi:MAG: hypothetical protein GX270_02460 [Clostridiaceae bacterium]|jgi:hypothetical protein|nr:hypothetical protein [Clostridiaceae bacterium]
MKRLQLDAIAFLFIIAVLGVANIINVNKPMVSEMENRALKQKPELKMATVLDGSYFSDYTEYYSDTFILRDRLLKISNNIQQVLFIKESDVKIIVSDKSKEYINVPKATDDKNEDNKENPSDETIPTGTSIPSSTPTPTNNPYNEGDGVGYWVVVDGKAVELFKFNKDNFDFYAQVLNKYNQKIGGKVPIYSLIAPTNSEFVQLRNYKGITDSQNNAIAYLNSKFSEEITAVNAYDVLNEHKDEYIYFRSDHHWTALGAYYAYTAFMETKGEEPITLDQYETVTINNFLGSTYAKTMDKSIEKNPDIIYAYLPFVNYKYEKYRYYQCFDADIIDMKYADTKLDKYLVFLSAGDGTWSKISTENTNGKKLLVIKDSYGNSFVPFLLPHYEEIYVIDPRFYDFNTSEKNIADFIESKGINEVLFVNYMENVNYREFMLSLEGLINNE